MKNIKMLVLIFVFIIASSVYALCPGPDDYKKYDNFIKGASKSKDSIGFKYIAETVAKDPKSVGAIKLGEGGFGAYFKVESKGVNLGVKVVEVNPKIVFKEKEAAKILADKFDISPKIFDAGILDDGRGYILREHVEGLTLRSIGEKKAYISKKIQKLLDEFELKVAKSGYAIDYSIDNIMIGSIGKKSPRVYLIDLGGAKQVCKPPVTEKCIKNLKAKYKHTRTKLFPTEIKFEEKIYIIGE